ncbi:MAG: hypothetical protein ACFB15_23675 [Cyclobacteriaceae bacterium]
MKLINGNEYTMQLIYPGKFEVKVQILSQQQLTKIIENKNGIVSKDYHKELTARTYQLESGQLIVKFYDRQGVLVNNIGDFQKLQAVKFIKNQVSYLHPRISYYFQLDKDEASRLIDEFEGKHLKEYKPEYEDCSQFIVHQLNSNQVIIRYEDRAYLYEDLEALAFDNSEVLNIHYPDNYSSGRAEFIKGGLPKAFNINSYHIYPNEARELIKKHGLTIAASDIEYSSSSKSILYQSSEGYYILMTDFIQFNRGGTDKIGIGTAYIFPTIEDFNARYKEALNWRKEIESQSEWAHGVHIYQDLSDKYGESFSEHTFEEINQLPSILNFDPNELAFTERCASILSESIKWNYGGEEFFNKMFHPILAYNGEYNKHEGKGDWDMRLDRKEKVWKPQFIDSDGKEVFSTLYLYDAFYEAEYGIPMVEYYIK